MDWSMFTNSIQSPHGTFDTCPLIKVGLEYATLKLLSTSHI